jgi:acyl carrier protein
MPYLPVNFVRMALGQYLDTNPSEIEPAADLQKDLGLEPLDLVLIVFRLEEFADAEFSISDLEGVVTVRDFEALVREWLQRAPIDDADDESRARPERAGSGTHVLGAAKVRAAR